MKLHTKICEMCGKEFQSKSALKRFCNEPHYVNCCICGAPILVPSNNVLYYFNNRDTVTCKTGDCRSKYLTKDSTREERAERMRQAMLRKYGVENPGQLKSVIEKREKTNLERYGTTAPINNPEIQKRMKETCQRKYDVDYVTQSQQFKDKAKETCLERYGVEFATQSEEFKEQAKQSMLERYGVEHAMQSEELLEKRRQSNIEKYGVDHPMKTAAGIAAMRAGIAAKHGGDPFYSNPEQRKQTCLEKYGVEYYLQSQDCREKTEATSLRKYGVKHFLQSPEVIERRRRTCIERYGSDNVFSSEYGMRKIRETMLERYGAMYNSQVPEIKAKATRNARNSKLEQRIFDLFVNYGIEFIHHFHLQHDKDKIYHEFDFYLPKYKILIDADGLYWHSYLSDPDGKRVIDYYDDIRMKLIPSDHQFYLLVEGNEDKQLKQLVKILEEIDAGIFDYDSYLFLWCRSIEFPYPEYSEKRMIGDWTHLCKYENAKYIPQCRIGESLIKHYHHSIFQCRRGNHISPLAAWYNDDMLKAVIRNRCIYVNDVDPSKILRGFNISKICPAVSIFNPILAKYLTMKYLSEFSEVFDPFSGFSGRLLGVSSAGKRYIGQDLNSAVIEESQQIIDFLQLSNVSVQQKDIFESSDQYECLLTCPPYDKKEVYSDEKIFQSCDDWISECLNRFDCKKYVFVVDETMQYRDNIAEVIKSTSHFGSSEEYVIVI